MTSIKIISNPYLKEIRYQTWNQKNDEWEDISATQSNSDLLSESLSKGFLPFKAKDILDTIISEYGKDGEKIEVQFEGANDEFLELESIVNDETRADKISLVKTSVELANARDILPKVKKLFSTISNLISECQAKEQTAQDIERFSDASSDIVPICVIGNYSAGKSTFINALIGCEILPSATEPSTSKVYKIARSKYKDRAEVKCSFKDKKLQIKMSDTDTKVDAGEDNELVRLLKKGLSEVEEGQIVRKVNKALSIINDYESENIDGLISDLIEVSLPFGDGVLSNSMHPFVIFDTPGSNSASNAKHLSVLKKAMANMTNGLPIFLCAPDTLDSTDNENLYRIITEMEKELDRRFTMIVVNKADETRQNKNMTEKEQEKILGQAVPRRLYAGGLFYASSIMGLGSKTNGEFFDDDYDYVYTSHEGKFSNPEDRHYMSLYHLDILPEQIKKRSEVEASEQENQIYANSGLFTIESAIESFAGKYAAYNKCFQSKTFLNNVIDITKKEIETRKGRTEEIRNRLEASLEKDKQDLIKELQNMSQASHENSVDIYPGHMEAVITDGEGHLEVDCFKQKEKEFTDNRRAEMNYESRIEDRENAKNEIADDFKSDGASVIESVKNVFKNEGSISNVGDALRNATSNLANNVKNYSSEWSNVSETRVNADKATAEDLINFAVSSFDKELREIHSKLDTTSRNFWEEKTNSIRKILADIVAGSEALTEEKQNELRKIIINYQNLEFTEDSVFDIEDFKNKIRFLKKEFHLSEKLNLNKLATRYNAEIDLSTKSRINLIEVDHLGSVKNWLDNLMDEICKNIVSYSPELSKQAGLIEEQNKQIKEWIDRQSKLLKYTKQLERMMDWQEVSKS